MKPLVLISVVLLSLIFIVILLYYTIIYVLSNRKFDKLTCKDVVTSDKITNRMFGDRISNIILDGINKSWKYGAKKLELDPWNANIQITPEVYTSGGEFDAIKLASQLTSCIGCSVDQARIRGGKLKILEGMKDLVLTGIKKVDDRKITAYIGVRNETKTIKFAMEGLGIDADCSCGSKAKDTKDLLHCEESIISATYCDDYSATVDIEYMFDNDKNIDIKFDNLIWVTTPILNGESNCSGFLGATSIINNIMGTKITKEPSDYIAQYIQNKVSGEILNILNETTVDVVKYVNDFIDFLPDGLVDFFLD